MKERLQLMSNLKESTASRASYIRGKLSVLIAAQLRALRLRRCWTQGQFANEAGMKQSRVSAMEQPGAVNFNVETLVRSAATLGVGLIVKFVPFSDMLRWENCFDQDSFDVLPIERDVEFLTGHLAGASMPNIFLNQIAFSPTGVVRLPAQFTPGGGILEAIAFRDPMNPARGMLPIPTIQGKRTNEVWGNI